MYFMCVLKARVNARVHACVCVLNVCICLSVSQNTHVPRSEPESLSMCVWWCVHVDMCFCRWCVCVCMCAQCFRSFTQQIFTKHLLCHSLCSSGNKTKVVSSCSFHFNRDRQ